MKTKNNEDWIKKTSKFLGTDTWFVLSGNFDGSKAPKDVHFHVNKLGVAEIMAAVGTLLHRAFRQNAEFTITYLPTILKGMVHGESAYDDAVKEAKAKGKKKRKAKK